MSPEQWTKNGLPPKQAKEFAALDEADERRAKAASEFVAFAMDRLSDATDGNQTKMVRGLRMLEPLFKLIAGADAPLEQQIADLRTKDEGVT